MLSLGEHRLFRVVVKNSAADTGIRQKGVWVRKPWLILGPDVVEAVATCEARA